MDGVKKDPDNHKAKYCLDANMLIEAHDRHYPRKIVPGYWDMMEYLGGRGVVFTTKLIIKEVKGEDKKELRDFINKISEEAPNKEFGKVSRCFEKLKEGKKKSATQTQMMLICL